MVHVHMNKLQMTRSTVCPGLTVEIRTFRCSRKLFLLHDRWLHSSIMSISGEKDSGCSLFGSKIVHSIMVLLRNGPCIIHVCQVSPTICWYPFILLAGEKCIL